MQRSDKRERMWVRVHGKGRVVLMSDESSCTGPQVYTELSGRRNDRFSDKNEENQMKPGTGLSKGLDFPSLNLRTQSTPK